MKHAILFSEKEGVNVLPFDSLSKKEWAEVSAKSEVAILVENQEDLEEARSFSPNLGYDFDFTAIKAAAKKIEDYK